MPGKSCRTGCSQYAERFRDTCKSSPRIEEGFLRGLPAAGKKRGLEMTACVACVTSPSGPLLGSGLLSINGLIRTSF